MGVSSKIGAISNLRNCNGQRVCWSACDCGDMTGNYLGDLNSSGGSVDPREESSIFSFEVSRYEIQQMPPDQLIAIDSFDPISASENEGFLSTNDGQNLDAAFSYCDSEGDCVDAGIDLSWVGSDNSVEMVNPYDASEGWKFHHKSEGGLDVFTRSVEKGVEFGSCDGDGQCRTVLISKEHDTDDEKKIDGYLFHKIGKNIGFRTMFAAAFAPRTVLMYRNYKSHIPTGAFLKVIPQVVFSIAKPGRVVSLERWPLSSFARIILRDRESKASIERG